MFCVLQHICIEGSQVIIYIHTSGVENCVDPDQLVSENPADLDLHCFPNGI